MDAEIRFDSRDVAGRTMVVATPVGDLDLSNATDFKAQLLGALARGPRLLVLDLLETTFIDSTILNALVAIDRRAELVGSRFCLTNVTSFTEKVFTITGLDRYLSIYSTTEAAIQAACQPVLAPSPATVSIGPDDVEVTLAHRAGRSLGRLFGRHT